MYRPVYRPMYCHAAPVFAAILLAATPALAKPVMSGEGQVAGTPLIAVSAFDPAALLPPPPKDGSPWANEELAELQRIEKTRSKADFARARKDDETENPMAFAAVMGPHFDLAKLPKTDALLKEVRIEEKAVAKRAKTHFQRNRPWIVDSRLVTCSREDGPKTSYPSGHTTLGYSLAVVLADLVPEKAPAIMARAADFAENRLVCAMHYRRDIVAGETLGTLIGYELLKNPTFRGQAKAAHAELVKAGIAAK